MSWFVNSDVQSHVLNLVIAEKLFLHSLDITDNKEPILNNTNNFENDSLHTLLMPMITLTVYFPRYKSIISVSIFKFHDQQSPNLKGHLYIQQ